MMRKFLILTLFLATLIGCNQKADDMIPTLTGGKIVVGNEGGFNKNNASVSLYSPDGDSIENQTYYKVNNFPLGDVLNSAMVSNGYIYFVMNGSSTVIVANALSFDYVATISGLTSPRYILHAEGKLFISDLYDTKLTVVDPVSYETIGTIELGATSEQLLYRDGYIYANAWSYDNRILKIDPRTNNVVATATVADQPNTMVFDANGKLWTLSGGGYDTTTWMKSTAGALTRINVSSMSVEATMTFADVARAPKKLQISGGGTQLYWLDPAPWGSTAQGGVFTMPITSSSLPATPLITSSSTALNGLGVNPFNGDIYVSDAGDYSSVGSVTRHNDKGEVVKTVTADIIPSFFVFGL